MRAYLLTKFYGQDITQNRSAFIIVDEVDSLLDEMGNILYLSHDIPDMYYLNNLFVTIWKHIHDPFLAEEKEEGVEALSKHLLEQITFGNPSSADPYEGKISIPPNLEAFVRRRLSTLIKSAYIAKNGLSRDEEYIIAAIDEKEDRGVYLIDQDTGVTALNKELANGGRQYLGLKHQDWLKTLSLKAIFCDPISFLMENYSNGFFGMTGTLGSEQDCRFFEKLFGIDKRCLIPRHELLSLKSTLQF